MRSVLGGALVGLLIAGAVLLAALGVAIGRALVDQLEDVEAPQRPTAPKVAPAG